MHSVYLSLGSNLGHREQHLRRAIALIGDRVGAVVRQSSVVETEPWGFDSPHRFLNAVVCCLTDKTPREVLGLTQQIERDMGRRKPAVPPPTDADGADRPAAPAAGPAARRYADRPIDIDILLYDDLRMDEPDLKIPHPLMYQRDFVMIPLREIMQ